MGSPCLLLLLSLSLLCGGLAQEDPGYQLCLQEELVVQEGLCARVSCSFSFPGNPRTYSTTVSWFREGDSVFSDKPVATNKYGQVKPGAKGRFLLLGNAHDLNCSLGIIDARRTDQGTYFFRVEQGSVKYSYKAKSLRVKVTELTEKPDIRVHEPLVSGLPGRLTCSLPGACKQTRPKFSWSGEMLGPGTHNSPELSLTPGPQDHGRNLSCRVRLQSTQERTTERTIRLDVSYTPRNLTIQVSFKATSETLDLLSGRKPLFGPTQVLRIQKSTSALSVLGGQTVWLLCKADSYPPAKLSWFLRSPGQNATIPSTSKAKLELRLPETAEDSEFICNAQNPQGSQNVSLRLSVLSPPQLLGPSCSWEAPGLRCSCLARARPPPSLSWWLDQELLPENRSNASFQINPSSEGPWVNSSLSLWEGFGTGLTVRCKAQNDHGAQSASILLLPGRGEEGQGKSEIAAVPPILGVAGVLALLSLCFCLVAVACVVRARRNVLRAGSGATASEDPVMDSVAWGPREKHQPESPPDQACSESGEAQELHYANLSFHGIKLRDPEGCEGPGPTEYSEIKTSQ